MKSKLSIFVSLIISLTLTSCAYDMGELGDAWFDEMPNGFQPTKNQQGGDKFDDITDNPFINTTEQPISTFSIDADGASYAYMRSLIKSGGYAWLNTNSVRIEEYLNYFTFDYASPNDGHAVALNSEIGICPWNKEHYLMRLGMKGKELTQEPQSNYVLMVDVSGSMNGESRLGLLKSGLIEMVKHLNADDRISIITYSGEVKLALESTLIGGNQENIIDIISKLVASGATAGGKAMQMAYDEAISNYIEGGNNRIIMGTDGDFNVGVSNTNELLEMVQDYCKKGIYITVCGFGQGNLNDSMMETISNKGNGTYVYVDSEEEMMKVFVHERSHFFAVANDCKAQVTFDSTMVAQYRLIGYENRVMRNEDFQNDSVDAAEIGAGQTITALYEIVPTEAWTENTICAKFDFRYKEDLFSSSIPLTMQVCQWTGEESENLRFAAAVACFGMLSRNSPYKGSADYDMVLNLLQNSCSFDPQNYRHEFGELVQKAQWQIDNIR